MATPSNHLRALTRLEDPQQKWDVIKPDFLRMYIQEGISMEDAIAAIRESHGFNASPRSFYDKIKEWGFQKNVKTHDMQWIVAKRTKRALEGKDTTFICGSLQVPNEQIDKAKRRKTMRAPLSISTPPNIIYYTPIPESEAASTESRCNEYIPVPSPRSQSPTFYSPCVGASGSVGPCDLQTESLQTAKFDVPTVSMLDLWLSDESSPITLFRSSYQLDDHESVLAKQQQMREQIAEILGYRHDISRPEICLRENQFLLGAQTAKDDNYLSVGHHTLSSGEHAGDDAEVVSLQDILDAEIALATYQEFYGDLAPQTLEKRFDLAKAFERSSNDEAAEYHCRRILVSFPQIDVLTFLGMLLVNASRFEEATFLLFSALTEFIVLFTRFSTQVNNSFLETIEGLFSEISLRDDHDWSSLTSSLIKMKTIINKAISRDTTDRIHSQLFLCGFSFAHECTSLGFIRSAMHIYRELLEYPPAELDTAQYRIENAKAHQKYGHLLWRDDKWAPSANQLLLAYKSVINSGTYDSQLGAVLETHYAEFLNHLSSLSPEESSLVKRTTEILTHCRSHLPQVQEDPATIRGSRVEEYLLSDDLPISFIPESVVSHVAEFGLWFKATERSSRSRDHTSTDSMSASISIGNKPGITFSAGSGCSIVSNSCWYS